MKSRNIVPKMPRGGGIKVWWGGGGGSFKTISFNNIDLIDK